MIKKNNYIFSNKAAADLSEIAEYISLDNLTRAKIFIEKIENHCKKISLAPKAFPLRTELGNAIRKSQFGKYAIFYLIKNDNIVIIRIIHSSRDVTNQFIH